MKILIVEDEVLLANSLKTLLETKGFTVEVVQKRKRQKHLFCAAAYGALTEADGFCKPSVFHP